MLNWISQFSTFCFLDNHQYPIFPHKTGCIAAAGVKTSIAANAGKALQKLQHFVGDGNKLLFGHLSYDLKNEIEYLSTFQTTAINFPDLFFFEPEVIIKFDENSATIFAAEPEKIFNEIRLASIRNKVFQPIEIKQRFEKIQYLEIIEKLKRHILRGDCYEINFCQEFFGTNTFIDPVLVYQQLSTVSPNPFSALYKVNNRWLICASPERFLKKNRTNNTIPTNKRNS